MSIGFETYIAFDDNTPEDLPVFSHSPSIWAFSDDYSLVNCGERRLYAALGFDPDNSFPAPLFQLRGVSDFIDSLCYASQHIEDQENVGWLDANEFECSLQHASIDKCQLQKPVQRLIHIIDYLSNIFGKERVRIVFVFIP
ncbi:hypothetical protein Pan241w_41580 [Gimesia alba]|uniref:Uncharacterized protein n=1 Tax=Gimesia alba TaxID=2527973 RepID=A0A517RJK7_9PLAN|nr:hypothetical protein [Gimesia alba]QDT44053.1 hypothetical protein Pan241w_41580 [Gimesia alba]